MRVRVPPQSAGPQLDHSDHLLSTQSCLHFVNVCERRFSTRVLTLYTILQNNTCRFPLRLSPFSFRFGTKTEAPLAAQTHDPLRILPDFGGQVLAAVRQLAAPRQIRRARGAGALPVHEVPVTSGGAARKCILRKCIFRKFCKFLAGSFSAVSKRNFSRKYAL